MRFGDQSLYRVTLTFGHCRGDGVPHPHSRTRHAQRRLLQLLSALYGGAQAVHHEGAYRHQASGVVVTERSTTIWSFTHVPRLPELTQAARWVGRFLDQETVLLVTERIEGQLAFVNAPARQGISAMRGRGTGTTRVDARVVHSIRLPRPRGERAYRVRCRGERRRGDKTDREVLG